MPVARSKQVEPPSATAAHCLPAFEKWMQSYQRVSTWIGKKFGGRENIYDAVAEAGGFLVIDDFLPANIAAGVESLLLRHVCDLFMTVAPVLTPARAACRQMHGTARKQKTTLVTTTSSTCSTGAWHLGTRPSGTLITFPFLLQLQRCHHT